MKLVIIDGQGGKMGRTVIEQLKKISQILKSTPLEPTVLLPLPC